MTEIAHSIDLDLPHKLRDKAYRRKFFWAETCAHIAKQLVDLRKRRGLNQKQVAEMTGTKQPAISRFEQADYRNRNLNTLLSIADVLDARVRVLIEPSEDILSEYDDEVAADIAETGEAEEQVESVFADDLVTVPLRAITVDVSSPTQLEGLAYQEIVSGVNPSTKYVCQETIRNNDAALWGSGAATDTSNLVLALTYTTAVLVIMPAETRPASLTSMHQW
jgi:transcriptional regulator with XRE-family HTH domain